MGKFDALFDEPPPQKSRFDALAEEPPPASQRPSPDEIRRRSHESTAVVPDAVPNLHAYRAPLIGADLAPPPTALGNITDNAGHIGRTFFGGMHAAAEGISHPIATVTDPAKRRQLERGVDDMVTLGYGQRAAGAIGRALGDQPDVDLQATEAADQQAAPEFRSLGNVAGMFTPGAASLIGRGASGVAGRAVAGAAPTSALGAAGSGAARGMLGYSLAAPVTAALSASAAGDRLGAAERAGGDLFGLGLSGVVGGGGAAAANRINNSRGAEARRLIEERGAGARVGVLTPGEGGVFARELAGVPANDRGIGVAARRGAERIVGAIEKDAEAESGVPYRDAAKAAREARAARAPKIDSEAAAKAKKMLADLEEKHASETTRPYRKLKAEIDASDAASNLRDVSELKQGLTALRYSTKMSPADQATAEALLRQMDLFTGPDGATVMTERALNDYKSMLQRVSKTGARAGTMSPKEASLAGIAARAKQMVDEGPYRDLNDMYARGKQAYGAEREGLGLKRKPGPDAAIEEARIARPIAREAKMAADAADQAALERAAEFAAGPRRQLGLPDRIPADAATDVKRVKLALMRRGQNTNTAGGDADIDAFARSHPNLQGAVDLPDLARARADLSLRLMPQHGGLFSRIAGAGLGPGPAAAAGLAAGMAGHGVGPALLGAGGVMAMQNATPIAGRLLVPLARAAPAAETAGAGIARAMQAARGDAANRAIAQLMLAARSNAVTPELIQNVAANGVPPEMIQKLLDVR
jgi:hypothetical protein